MVGLDFKKDEAMLGSPSIVIETKYELAIKTYGGGGAETEYYPIMDDGTAIVKKTLVNGNVIFGSNYGTLDCFGREKIPCIWDSCKPINSKYYIVGKNNTEGYYNHDDYSFPNQKYGIVNEVGELVIPVSFSSIYFEDSEVSLFKSDGSCEKISMNGENISGKAK